MLSLSLSIMVLVGIALQRFGDCAGSGSVPCAILKPPAKLGFASVPARQQGSNAAVAKAAALNPQALPYVPPGTTVKAIIAMPASLGRL